MKKGESMKTTLVLFYKKHPYFTLLINI
ncbi:hypothetical protein BXA50_11190, partial [Enterococcus faecium]